MCLQPAVTTPAITPELKGYNCTVRSCGRSGRVGDKGDRGTGRVMKADLKEKGVRQENVFAFLCTFLSYTDATAKEAKEEKQYHSLTHDLIP